MSDEGARLGALGIVTPVRGRSRLPVAAALVAAALLACAPTAPAASRWLSPVDLSAPGKDANHASVAMDAAGNAVAVWEREVIVSNSVQASVRNAGGSFSAPIDLSTRAKDPAIAITPGGVAVAAWWHFANPPGLYVLQVSTRPPGGAFSAPVDVTVLPPGVIATRPRLDVSTAGDVALAWVNRVSPEPTQEEEENEETPSPVAFVEASVRPAGGGFSGPEPVSELPLVAERQATNPEVAIDGSGAATVVWSFDDGTDEVIQASVRPPGGAFSAPQQISEAGGAASTPRVAMDNAGRAIAVFAQADGEDSVVRTAVRAPGGAYGTPEDLSAAGANAVAPRVAMAPGGAATAIWTVVGGSNRTLKAADAPPGGTFGGPLNVSTPEEEPGDAALALNAGGDAIVIWAEPAGGDQVVAATRSGGSFAAPTVISPGGPALFPAPAIDGSGNAIVAWRGDDGANTIVRATGYDFSSPRIRSLSIPPTGTVGVPVTFAADPFDVWPIASAAFDFGDGTALPGTAVSHVYSAPGTYQVAFTATDHAGNPASAAGAISIAPSYGFRIGKRKRVKRRGIMLLGVDVSGPGRVFVNGRLVKRRVRPAASAKRVWIPVIARGKALKRLRKRGKSRAAAFVSFRPNGGTHAARRRLVVVLVKKQGRRGKANHRRTRR